MDQLAIFIVVEEREHGDAIGDLEAKRVGCIINNNDIFQVTTKDAKVFYMDPVDSCKTGVSINSLLKELMVRIYVIKDGICVMRVGSCEKNNLPILLQLLNHFFHVGSDVDS